MFVCNFNIIEILILWMFKVNWLILRFVLMSTQYLRTNNMTFSIKFKLTRIWLYNKLRTNKVLAFSINFKLIRIYLFNILIFNAWYLRIKKVSAFILKIILIRTCLFNILISISMNSLLLVIGSINLLCLLIKTN